MKGKNYTHTLFLVPFTLRAKYLSKQGMSHGFKKGLNVSQCSYPLCIKYKRQFCYIKRSNLKIDHQLPMHHRFDLTWVHEPGAAVSLGKNSLHFNLSHGGKGIIWSAHLKISLDT